VWCRRWDRSIWFGRASLSGGGLEGFRHLRRRMGVDWQGFRLLRRMIGIILFDADLRRGIHAI
jgi:hypothetical protein